MPLIPGRKSAAERFAGADETYTIEVLTQNGMAIQAGTSHFLGQSFAKAFDVKFKGPDGSAELVWASSWGVSTRLIGALIQVHADDEGLVLPPKLAPTQVVIVPMYGGKNKWKEQVEPSVKQIKEALEPSFRVHVDERDTLSMGEKFFWWEQRGVPIRLELGPRDLERGVAIAKLRTGGDRFDVPLGDAATVVEEALERVQRTLRERADALKDRLTFKISTREEFDERLAAPEPGMMWVPWGGDSADEEALQKETGATHRCTPLEQPTMPPGQVCPLTGKPAREWAIFARAY